MRILLTAGWLGGAGGAERAVYAALQALDGDQVDVVVREELGGEWAQVPESTTVISISDWRWRGATHTSKYKDVLARKVVNPVRKRLLPTYDLHLGFKHGPNLTPATRSNVRLYIPCGNETPMLPESYDLVALEAPDNGRLVGETCPRILLPPPLAPISDSVVLVEGIPDRFFLTVFNPYSPVKGEDDLARAADSSPLPIVWCHSNQTLRSVPNAVLAAHPNIVHVDDPAPAELRYLYENCRAYLSFSREEGFGWAAADGLQHSRSVVSRAIGVFSFPEAQQPGVHLIGERWEFDWSLFAEEPEAPPERDLSWLSPAAFRDRLGSIVAGAEPENRATRTHSPSVRVRRRRRHVQRR